MTHLNTRYLGLELKNPIVPASSPLSTRLDGLRRLEDAGAAAVTLFSLFEEQIEHETIQLANFLDATTDAFQEAASYFPAPEEFHRGPVEYLELIRQAKSALEIPVIPSLNGVSEGGWVEFAKQIEQAGADALELNIYWIETDLDITGEDLEARYLSVVKSVTDSIKIPVAVKVGPYFSAMGNMARGFAAVGAKGLVLFNRYYQPDFDIDRREVKPHLVFSMPTEMRLPLHWTAILCGRVDLDIAITSGVHSATDVLKAMMAGAKVATMASALLERGPDYIGKVLRDVEAWMHQHEFESIQQMQGSMSYRKVANTNAYERANYMKELQSLRADPILFR